VTCLIDPNEWEVVERYTYTPYGAVTIHAPDWTLRDTSAYNNTRLYTGREYDVETGMYHYRRRYYHAQLARFTSRDPMKYKGRDPNLYRYVSSGPTNATDPLGLAETIERKYRCNIPITGQTRTVTLWFECCLPAQRQAIGEKMCDVLQAMEELNVYLQHLEGTAQSLGNALTSGANTPETESLQSFKTQLDRFFGDPIYGRANAAVPHIIGTKPVPSEHVRKIGGYVRTVMRAFDEPIGIQCDGDTANCSNKPAFTFSYWTDIHICPLFWTKGHAEKAGVLAHELFHEYANMEDEGQRVRGDRRVGVGIPAYLDPEDDNGLEWVELNADQLLVNPSTYELLMQTLYFEPKYPTDADAIP